MKLKVNLEFRDLIWERQEEILKGFFPDANSKKISELAEMEEISNLVICDGYLNLTKDRINMYEEIYGI